MGVPLACSEHTSVLHVHSLSMIPPQAPDPKPLALKPSEKWILHTLYKDVKDQAEKFKNQMRKFVFQGKFI